MNVDTSVRGTVEVLRLHGHFDFLSYGDFVQAIKGALEHDATQEIQVNFEEVDYIDSAAFGMLLLLRDKARQSGKSVSLTGATGAVKQALHLMASEKLFVSH
jgi:anti-anti-sigma factor